MNFSPDALLAQLDFPAGSERVVVAYSGGLDSTVLLHALAARRHLLPGPLHAVHVDHGLQPESPQWAEHCRTTAERLDVGFDALQAQVDLDAGIGPEAAAREARFDSLAGLLEAGDCLLTAQHADDQAETFLLQALRGAGPSGLAAMPARRPLGDAWLLRPLLRWSRAELENWADHNDLDWIDDPSNASEDFDRNYLRHRVMPVLRQRWPAFATTLSRAARHCADAADINAGLGQELLAASDAAGDCLPLAALAGLDEPRQRVLLRSWLDSHAAPVPSEAVLETMRGLCGPRAEGAGEVHWAGHVLRRHREALHLELDAADAPRAGEWDTASPFELGGSWGRLRRRSASGVGLDPAIRRLQLGYREGGERLQPAGSSMHRELKKLLQEAGIPRWQRSQLPLLYHDGELVAVGDRWISEAASVDSGGWQIEWQDSPLGGD